MRIKSKSGVAVHHLSDLDEAEALFATGSKFRLVGRSVEETDLGSAGILRRLTLDVEEI